MGNFIPVEPEKWAEMVKALALVAEMDKTINASQAECRRLKAEVERLTEKSACQTECLDAFDKKLRQAEAHVERLIKAGDAIIQNLDPDEGDWSHEDAQAEWSYAKQRKNR